MAKFGKKNVIKIDPLAYNIGLLGESGIGKTSLFVKVLEKLAGKDGYMILNCGMEDGIDAIPGAIYEDIPDYDTLEEFVDDIIENKETDYPNLKVIAFDTMDELFRMTEPEVVRMHNREKPDKPVKSIKAAMGGYQAGEDKVIELLLNKISLLKRAGIAVWFIGHTKRKSMTDLFSGAEYEMITNNMLSRYFNAIKDKLHIMGIAFIDRDIDRVKGKKKDDIKGIVQTERRKISFRDDNYNIESKSRFADIVDEINLDPDEFIQALTDAIRAEHNKQDDKEDIKEVAKKQEIQKEKESKENIDKMKLKKYQEEILEFIKGNKKDVETLKPILKKSKELGISDIKNIKTLGQAEEILKMCE